MAGPDIDQPALKGKYVIFKPLIENFSTPFTPLTADIIGRVPMTGVRMIRGWMYFNLRWVRFFTPWRVNDKALAKLIYLSGPAPTELPVVWYKLVFLFLVAIVCYMGTGVLAARTRNMPDDFMEGLREHLGVLESDPDIDVLEVARQIVLLTKFFEPVGRLALLINISSARYFVYLFVLKIALKHWAPALTQDAAGTLCSGGDGISTADMGAWLWRLSRIARAERQVCSILLTKPPGESLRTLRDLPDRCEFIEAFDQFLSHHGHRAVRELELSAPRWLEDPTPVIAMMKNLLAVEGSENDQPSPGAERRTDTHALLAVELAKQWLEPTT